MILIWGPETDGPLEAVRGALAAVGAPVFLLAQERARDTEIRAEAADGVSGTLRVGEEVCDLASLSAIYLRCHETRSIAPGADADRVLAGHADRIDAVMGSILDVTAARVVNPMAAMASNNSKPYQSATIAAHGFAIPETLVTTDPEAARAFAERHGAVIYKSVSGVRSIVTRLGPEDGARLDDVQWCPTQFQRHIPGRDFRVHVIGDAAFSAEVVSEADDYRYAARDGLRTTVRPARVPAAIEEKCHALARALGLAFAGIDLRRTPDGEWFCFEVNPSPAFTYYAAATGQPIAAAVAALLRGR